MACIDVFFKGPEGINYDYKKDRKCFGIFINKKHTTTVIMRPNQILSEALDDVSESMGYDSNIFELIEPIICSTGNIIPGNFNRQYSNDYADRSCFYFTI
jgi:hypothetical protein